MVNDDLFSFIFLHFRYGGIKFKIALMELEWGALSQTNLQYLSYILFSFLPPHRWARRLTIYDSEM